MTRFIIGIDLGTTNSCVFYADTQADRPRIQHFKIAQLNAQDHLEHLPTLGSYYLKDAHPLPWDKHRRHVVGQRAFTAGERLPTRLVQSAKSWLCHHAAARHHKILPPEASDESDRISPVEASTSYLLHMKEAWNHTFAKGDPEAFFEEQEIVLTVPASFDEGARTLTLQAAKTAGFRHVTLLEEPQAAFYAWMEKNAQTQFPDGTQILVADVGGGTTDFSLISVQEGSYVRMAVGNHLLLGGDNIDQAIAHKMLEKMKQKNNEEPSLTQWLQLKYEARKAKEAIFSGNDLYRVVIQGVGAKVIAGASTIEMTRKVIESLVMDGFFPVVPWEKALQVRKKSALNSMGLPYESEPAITKQLALFYHSHASQNKHRGPDYVLFNGGSFKPEPFRAAILDSLQLWFPESAAKELPSHNLDLAVGHGACYYGLARRGFGIQIKGGSARAFYLEVEGDEAKPQALTVLPRGEEEGYFYRCSREFTVRANTSVSFRVYSSHVRIHDAAGDVVAMNPLEMHPLPPIQTQLSYGKGEKALIPVFVEAELTTLGILALQLKARDTPHVWKLEFQLKAASGQEDVLLGMGEAVTGELFDQELIQELREKVKAFFATGEIQTSFYEPLEDKLQQEKGKWPASVLRALFDALIEASAERKKSTKLRNRWWNAVGYFLRPGFGYPLDDFRIKALWKCFLEDKNVLDEDGKVQFWIALRRIAGGLIRGQQQQVAADLLATLGEQVKGGRDEYARSEKIRLLAALEWLDRSVKLKWGTTLVNKLVAGKGNAADFWALGRMGARELLYAPYSSVLPVHDVSRWIERLLESRQLDEKMLVKLLEELARKTSHREINIPESLVLKITEIVQNEELKKVLTTVCAVTAEEKEWQYGDSLPLGVILTTGVI